MYNNPGPEHLSSTGGVVSDLTRLGYGAANLGNLFRELTDEQAWEIMDAAWESGIRYFDTAPHYGLGLSERRVGEFLRTKPRNDYVVSTKVGRLLRPNPDDAGGLDLADDFHVRTTLRREWDFTAAGIRTSLEESLERMGLDRVDILYLHDPERYDMAAALHDALPAMEELRSSGIVDAIGVGSMVSSVLASAVTRADLNVVMVAGRYTLLDQPASIDLLPAARERGTALVAASVLGTGVLAHEDPSREARYEYGRMSDAMWNRLQRIREICLRHGVPLPVAAVRFPLECREVQSVVIGASRPAQIWRSAELMDAEVPAALWHDLESQGLVAPMSGPDAPGPIG